MFIDDDKKQLLSNKYLLGVKCKVSKRTTLKGETFCFPQKGLLSMFKFCASSNLLSFCELLTCPQLTFLECIVIFP